MKDVQQGKSGLSKMKRFGDRLAGAGPFVFGVAFVIYYAAYFLGSITHDTLTNLVMYTAYAGVVVALGYAFVAAMISRAAWREFLKR